jgi:predicted choloylglycine hydrolase
MSGRPMLTLQGDHFQMGLQHGRQVLGLRPQILEAIDRRLAVLEDRPIAGLLREVEQAWAAQARSTLDMLAGIAKTLEVDVARLLRYAVASYLEDRTGPGSQAEGCTVWAAAGPTTAGGLPILAKNRDYSLAHTVLQTLAHATPREGHRYLYVTSAGSPGVFSSGMNEQGLAIADTHVLSSDLGPGLARYTLMMELLERYASASLALAYLRRAPQMGGGNMILLDAQGKMAVFEAGHRHWGIIYPRQHVVTATNHFVTPAMRGQYRGGDAGGPDGQSEARLRTIRRHLRADRGRLDADRARQIMASHSNGGAAMCRHATEEASGTISTVIFFPAERSLLFSHGRPCEADFTRHAI